MTRFLLDTCVVSEFTRRQANAGLIDWLATEDESAMFLSEVTLGELEKGLHKLPPGMRRTRLRSFVEREIVARFGERIVSVDANVWRRWGRWCGEAERRGRPLPVIDSLLAATASVHELAIVTRNERDFGGFGVRVVNPWR